MDQNVEPRRDVPMWSETRWNGCWNAAHGVGLYLHMGRFRKDLDLWWAQTVAYLPEGRLAVDRTWGRCTDRDGVRVGNLDLTMTEDGWTSTFDGVGELTTIDELARAPRGAAAPSVPVRWEVTAKAVTPEWDLYGGWHTEKQEWAGDSHVQGGFEVTGTLVVDGREYPLDGPGFKDHSSGVRHFDGWSHHRFILAVLPGWTLHAGAMYRTDGSDPVHFGMSYRDGSATPVTGVELPLLTDLGLTGPEQVEVTLAEGATLTLTAELVHALPVTLTRDNDNINGLDWDSPGAVALSEGIAKITTPDGTVGYTFYERSARLEDLERPRG